jgi:antitoxin MazE
MASVASPSAAIELAVDQAQQLDPLVTIPRETATFSKKLLPLWEQALDRPDAEPRRLAIDTIRLARGRGMEGLEATVPRLTKALVEEMGLVEGDELEIVEAVDRTFVRTVDRRSEFLKNMRNFVWPAPDDYKFDRDEANAR